MGSTNPMILTGVGIYCLVMLLLLQVIEETIIFWIFEIIPQLLFLFRTVWVKHDWEVLRTAVRNLWMQIVRECPSK